MYEVLFYTAGDDDCPVQAFLDELPAKPRAKALRAVPAEEIDRAVRRMEDWMSRGV